MTHVQYASGPGASVFLQADRLQLGKQRAAFKRRVSCPKVKSLLTNQLKVGLDGSNTIVMTDISSHTKANKSYRPMWQKQRHKMYTVI